MNLGMAGVREAAEMRLIGLLFERPREGTRGEAAALAREVEDVQLHAIAERLQGLDEPTYVSLLGPGGPVSPREVAYRTCEDPGWVMADVSAFYRAFGYRPRAEDPVDHVAVEAGFVAYLRLKEVYAAACGESAELTAAARARFVESHLSTLAAGIAARMGTVQAPELLALAGALLARTGGSAAPIREDRKRGEGDEMTCGSCAAGDR